MFIPDYRVFVFVLVCHSITFMEFMRKIGDRHHHNANPMNHTQPAMVVPNQLRPQIQEEEIGQCQ